MISLFWSCTLPTPQPPSTHCFSEIPEEGTVRLHSVSCSAEIESSFVRRGDWILENHVQKVVVRHQSSSLTYETGPGASIIQIGAQPILLELRGIELPYPLNPVLHIHHDSATLSFEHEEEHILSYTLHADDHSIEIDSAASFFFTPLPISKQAGNTFYTQNRENGLLIDGRLTQEDQGFRIDQLTALHTTPWNTMYEAEGSFVEQSWNNEDVAPHALLLRDNQDTWFLPFLDESFSGYIPSQATQWTLWHPSCAKNWVSTDNTPTLGLCSEKQIRSTSEAQGIWTFVNETLIPPQGGLLSFGQDEYIVSAGSAYEQETLSSDQNYVELERIFPHLHLFSPLEISTQPQKTLARLLGNGIENTVISTKNFISPFSIELPPFQEHIHAQKGFIIEQGSTWLLSWPWEPIIREPGMGAVPYFSSYQSQLSYVDRQGRISVGNLSFLESLQSETEFAHPDFIFLSDITQREKLYEQLDQREPLRFMGPMNAVQHPSIGPLPESLLVRALLNQEHSFGNGPVIFLDAKEDLWNIDAYAPSWMDVESIHLMTQEGTELGSWDFNEETHLSVSFPQTDVEWVLAEVRGSHWAISPIVLSAED